MAFLRALEKRLGWLAVPNITLYLMVGQILVYGLTAIERLDPGLVVLVGERVLAGEVWRVFSFWFMPPIVMHPIFMAFAWYIFYMMGTALEDHWGTFRYNLFLFVGFVATVVAALVFPQAIATNGFVLGSVFLAFAFLNPDFQLALFLILPIKIKWLALLMWVGYGFNLVFGSWPVRAMVLASVVNFALFFGHDILFRLKARQRKRAFEAHQEQQAEEPFHRCHICGITDRSNPSMTFRYCSACEGDYEYCERHLRNHEHVKAKQEKRD